LSSCTSVRAVAWVDRAANVDDDDDDDDDDEKAVAES
jgi:hypothetical protein